MIILLKTILYLAQGTALWASIVRYKFNKTSTQRYFLHFMIFVAIIEISANLARVYTSLGNSFVYNIYIISSFYFFFYWFYTILKQKVIVFFVVSCYTIALFVSLYLESFFNSMLSITLYSGTIGILILSTAYYYSLLQGKEVINFVKLQPFWIATGLLIFYIGFLPVQFLQGLGDFDKINYQFVIMILNILLYGCFVIALLCPLKK